MKSGAVRSDLRVCASGEPEPEPEGRGPVPLPGVQQVDETGNVLSEAGSQGIRKQTDFGPELN